MLKKQSVILAPDNTKINRENKLAAILPPKIIEEAVLKFLKPNYQNE